MKTSRQIVTRSAASGTGGAVAAARQETAEAGARMLELGGNAVDAAVAMGFVAGVVEPMETTVAGSGFMLVHVPADGKVLSVEFGPRAPAAARPDMYTIDTTRAVDRGLGVSIVVNDENVQGPTSLGVPGTMTALIDAHARFGSLPLTTVMAPAIAAANDGFAADAYYALAVLMNHAALRADPGAASVFFDNGNILLGGHMGDSFGGPAPRVKQKALARTLEVLAAKGAAAVREGEIGDALVATMKERGGLLSRDDLRGATPHIGEARRITLRDHEIWGPAAPCGTLTQIQMLKTWLALYPERAPSDDTPERITRLAALSWHAFADRYHWLGDPERVAVPEQALASDAYAAEIAATITRGDTPPRVTPAEGMPWEVFAGRAAHDPWPFQAAGMTKPVWRPIGGTEPTSGTTHMSVIDRNGMAVSLTHTAANHFGAKVVCPRTGLLFDCAMGWFNACTNAANSIAGGKRPLANMAPVMITKDGRVTAALGAPGGRRIISAVFQVTLNLVERGMEAADAVLAPRIDASGSTMLASERLKPVLAQLDRDALPWQAVTEQHQPFGYEMARPVLVTRDAAGSVQGVTDPFAKGFAIAV